MQTTAIYPNRIQDKEQLEKTTGLSEFGNETTTFLTKAGALFAVGYVRIVYGDHGPYIEFEAKHIKAQLKRKFNRPLPSHCFYEWLETTDSSVKVYDQKRNVKHLKNPPQGGFVGNREEGYADYRSGYLYVAPNDLNIDRIQKEPVVNGIWCGDCPHLAPYGEERALTARCMLKQVELEWYDYWLAVCRKPEEQPDK